MKVLGFVGSERKNGNTDLLTQKILKGVASCGIEVEQIYLSDLTFVPCNGCEGCRSSFRCVKKDDLQEIYNKIDKADGIVLASPTYFYNITSITKAFLERLYCYDLFHPEDRSVWLNLNELIGTKFAVTLAICEQNNTEDMGVTSLVMDKSLQAVGFRIVESMKALHLFEKGACINHDDILTEADAAGQKLGKTILLANKMKNLLQEKKKLKTLS